MKYKDKKKERQISNEPVSQTEIRAQDYNAMMMYAH